MDEIISTIIDKNMIAAEAVYEINPCEKIEKWIENLGYNLGIMGINKPIKTPIFSNKISKNER